MSHFHTMPSQSSSLPFRLSGSLAATHPLRRVSGLVFVVLLHIAAIVAIKSGLVVSFERSTIPPVHVLPTFDTPKPIPLPIETITPKNPSPSTVATEIPKPFEMKTESAQTSNIEATTSNTDTKVGDTNQAPQLEIIIARVDPMHPLTQPNYPPASRRANEQGRVELMLYILPNGKVGEAQIAQSSGYARLDESALREALRSWRFIPQQENGVAVPSWQRFAINFRLER